MPYANVQAYREISKVLEHKYVWSAEFGCYVVIEDEEEAGLENEDEGRSMSGSEDAMET